MCLGVLQPHGSNVSLVRAQQPIDNDFNNQFVEFQSRAFRINESKRNEEG